MLQKPCLLSGRLSRRSWLASVVVASCAVRAAAGQENAAQEKPSGEGPDPNCPRCGGLGRIPMDGAKPFVWTKGSPLPKWDSAAGERFCPTCQTQADAALLAAHFKEQ